MSDAFCHQFQGIKGFQINSPRKTLTSMKNQGYDDSREMDAPYDIYPENDTWAWERASPKTSLTTDLHQSDPAPAWLLNIIESAHWVSFPIGFYIASYLFNHANEIASAGNWSGSTNQVFFLMLGLLNQVFGGGMAVLMHVYEGWMIAPFKNVLALPENPTRTQIDAIRIKNYNNAWLRAASYQMLMTFQSLGLSLFTMGVFGEKPWTAVLVLGTALIALLGPKEPRLELKRKVDGEDRPVLPLSVSLALVLAANVFLQLLACIKLFYPIFAGSGMAPALALVACILPSTLQGAGGGIEGYFAESSFKQWQHLGAFLILLSGFILLGGTFHQMVTVGPTPDVALPSFLEFLNSW